MVFCVPYNSYSLYCYLTPQTSTSGSETHSNVKSNLSVNISSFLYPWNSNSSEFLANFLAREQKKKKELEQKCYESLDKVEWLLDKSRYWIEGIVMCVVGGIGILGNLLSLHILRKDSMRKTSFDEMLTHLLILDTILVIFFLLDSMTTVVLQTQPNWYKILYPYVIHPGKAISMSATVLMVVAVSADRQRAICHSMLYRVSYVC